MAAKLPSLMPHHLAFVNRLLLVAEADSRLAAVALVGSNATGQADRHSDLDLVLVAEDEGYRSLIEGRDEFLGSIEEPLWLESWGREDSWFYIFASGVEGDLTVLPVAGVSTGFTAPFVALLDKPNLLAGVQPRAPEGANGKENLEQLVRGFWHEFSHVVTALGRGKLWWAEGQLEELRGICINLLRLRTNFDDPEVGDEPYWKVELSLSAASLAKLMCTLNTFESDSMRAAAAELARLYRELAEPLALEHGLPYPSKLEQMMIDRLGQLPR